jgi:hypothetical protein
MKHLFGLIPVCLIACATEPAVEAVGDHTIDGARLRIVAGNLPAGTSPTYNDGSGIRIFQGLDADVALVQEVKYTAGARAFVDTAFGTEFQFVIGTGRIPNAVVSRYPIVEGGEWDDRSVSDRGFTWARIDIPGDIDLWAVSIHLLTRSAGARNTQAHDLIAEISAVVPSSDWVVIGGDLNTNSRGESAINTLGSVVETSGPYPVDRNGNGNTNQSRGRPYDWVLVSEALDDLETPVVIGSNEFANGLVADTRVYSPIAELAPARSSDSGTNNMQHMAVVRDFDIPDGETPSSVHVDSPNGGEELAIGSHHAITWTATGIGTVDIDYATDGTSFTRVATVPASAGAFDWTVPGPATTTGKIRIAATTGNPSDSSDADFTTIGTTNPGQVILNEVLANELGTATAGEFIELVNLGGTAVDISGWTLADSVAPRHMFPSGTTLLPGARIVVWGNTATTGALGLSNAGDTVTLADAGALAVDSFTFGGSPDGVSFNRSPDATTGSFVLHTSLSSALSSPGGAP